MNDCSIGAEAVIAERFVLCEGEEAEGKMGIISKAKGNLGKLGRG